MTKNAKSGDPNLKWSLVALISILAFGGIVYRVLVDGKLQQSAALFIGLPALLSILFTLTPPAKSATGMIFKGITLALLMSGIFFGEGYLCILMAAPLFYGVGLIVGVVVDAEKNKTKPPNSMRMFIFAPLILSSFEGVTPQTSFNRLNEVTSVRLVQASPEAILSRLSQTPRFTRPLPAFLAAGFPRPTACYGRGLKVGDRRVIHFTGSEGKPGDLTLAVTQSTAQKISFTVVSDTSHLPHWLNFLGSDVYLSPVGKDQTEVQWVLRYQRRLDPAWYFSPLERYGCGLAADVLVDNLTEN